MLIITDKFGPCAFVAGLYRTLSTRVTFRVLLREPLKKVAFYQHLVLKMADGVLVDGDAAHRAASAPGFPARSVCRLPAQYAVDLFLHVEPRRSPETSRRIVVVGDLTPSSGVADLLGAAMVWAEAHPDLALELWWVGDGDLAGVLAAQPLPANVSQVFHGQIERAELPAMFEQAGLLVVPSITEDARVPVAEAFATGLPVAGSVRSSAVRHLVTEGVTGWLFDPLQPGSILDAIDRALATSEEKLAAMRLRTRAAVTAMASGNAFSRVDAPSIRPASPLVAHGSLP